MGASVLHGLSAETIAAACRVSLETARRWKRTGSVPAAAGAWLELVVGGELGALTGTWAGWKLERGELVSPGGTRYSPGHLEAVSLRLQQIAALEREVRRLEAAASGAGAAARSVILLDAMRALDEARAHLAELERQAPVTFTAAALARPDSR